MSSARSTPRASLARTTLIKMGVRVAIVIVLATVASYLHILYSMRDEALAQLERYVTERSQREQTIFVLAQDNHAVLQQALAGRIEAWRQQDPDPRFNSLFALLPDGTIRNNPRGFDGTRMPGVYVPRGVNADEDFRRRLVAAYEVVAEYGPAFHVRFMNTGIMLPEGVLVGYWPEGATWFQDVDPTFSILELEYFTLALPENNPERKSVWTNIFEDVPSKTWMVTIVTPVEVEGRFVAAVTHDTLLSELMRRTLDDHLPGAYNILFREDGQLIAHPEIHMESGGQVYNILSAEQEGALRAGTAQQRAHLRAIFDRVKARKSGERLMELPEYEEFIAVARLESTGWNFVTVLPEHVVSAPAVRAARYVLLFGMGSLLMELAIIYWVLRQQITRPLVTFTRATDQVAAGDFKVSLDSRRDDELGRLASAFRLMAQEVRRREEALRQANEGLEQRVEERTRELKELHRQLVQTARQAGMAEIATNVLHNVGNVLNSVHTSALLAKERASGMKLEQVGRVAALLEEQRADLGTFLTQSERGRNVLPFLSKLGETLVDERQELLTLLGDVDRYTEHIGTIVKLQQRYARQPRMEEPARLEELLEDALRINAAALGRHQVKVERSLAPLQPVVTDKHKVLMILVNLISNAKYAMDGLSADQRRLTLRMEPPSEGRVRIEISDNGMGIAPEMLTRIFQYGFTTRKEGHGFGLHSSALAAQELGGSLTVRSEGPGHGATFCLELPYRLVEQSA